MMLSGKDFSWRLDIEKAINFAQDKIKSEIFFHDWSRAYRKKIS